MSKQLIAYAIINSGSHEVEEDFNVDSKETADIQIKETIKHYNETLQPGETKRSFKGIVRFEEKDENENIDDDYYEDEDDDFWEEQAEEDEAYLRERF